MAADFTRDRLTWMAYVVLAWFAYLQAAPGLVVVHLRSELDLSYAVGGLHVAAFAAGSTVAGLTSARLERLAGRRLLLWSAAALMAAGTVGLTAAQVVSLTVGSVLVMGLGGGLVLSTVQALLADHHGAHRTVALAEANVAAGVSYVVVVGALSLAAALQAGWRAALLVSLVVPALAWVRNRHLAFGAPAGVPGAAGRLPRPFWIAAGVLVCTTAAEWCVTSWGASFVQDAAAVSADLAVVVMAGFFGGVLGGRLVGSRLARRHDPARLLAAALAIAGAGFVVLWSATTPTQALIGLVPLGVGIGNLFPMGVALAVEVAPGRSGLASARAVAMTSFAVLLAPLAVGALADATSLKAALGVVPVLLVLAAAGLALVGRARATAAHA
jgi:MFS family permease